MPSGRLWAWKSGCKVSVAIIVNPRAGHDVRRLIAPAHNVSDQEKVGIIRRVLVALDALSVSEIWLMPDDAGISHKALSGCHLHSKLRWLAIPIHGVPDDTRMAAKAAVKEGVRVLVTLGGDGTNRLVVREAEQTPIVPISTGTNNAFPVMMDGTLAGLAAGLVAEGYVKAQKAVRVRPKLEVRINGQAPDIALVDVMATDDTFVASRAIWEWAQWREAVVLAPQVPVIGVASMVVALQGFEETGAPGMHFLFGPGKDTVMAPISPGLIGKIPIVSANRIVPETPITFEKWRGSLALDGEREYMISPKQSVSVRLLADGVRIIDIWRCFNEAARSKVWTRLADFTL